ncbi:hypothetical protein [Burkholderia cepacia]|uniref:hypothetical protein n=1 Tax=Burkholderia cepacia TaxID=292 RepID=UPI000F5F2676|nr:hypothetical protein [Burkholderia cepacia]
MDKLVKESAFVVLKAFDRLGRKLGALGVSLPQDFSLFLDRVWEGLAQDVIAVKTKGIEKVINSLVVDEQDAGHDEILRNMYLYAFSSFLIYVENGSLESLSATEEGVVDFYDYVAGQRYLVDEKKGAAVILSAEDERKILMDSEYRAEREALESDRMFSKNINNWSEVNNYR